MQDYGGQIESIDDYDEMLDRWGEMLEDGDSAGALEMLSQRLPKIPGMANIEDYLAKVSHYTASFLDKYSPQCQANQLYFSCPVPSS